MSTNTLPGFFAESTIYRSAGQYLTTAFDPDATRGMAIIPQLPLRLSPDQLYWCRLACLYCRYTGYYCWPCFVCALIISTGGVAQSPGIAA